MSWGKRRLVVAWLEECRYVSKWTLASIVYFTQSQLDGTGGSAGVGLCAGAGVYWKCDAFSWSKVDLQEREAVQRVSTWPVTCCHPRTTIVYHFLRETTGQSPSGCNGTFPNADFTLTRAYAAMVSMFTAFLVALCMCVCVCTCVLTVMFSLFTELNSFVLCIRVE